MKSLGSGKWFLIIYIVFLFFPALRSVVCGGGVMDSWFSVIITLLPDILLMSYLLIFLFNKKNEILKFWKDEKLILVSYFLIIIYGFVLNMYNTDNLRAFVYGYRVSYFPFLFYIVGKLERRVIVEEMVHQLMKVLVVYSLLSLFLHVFFFDFESYLIHDVNKRQISSYYIPRTGGFLLTPVLFSVIISAAIIYYSNLYLKNSQNILDWSKINLKFLAYLMVLFIANSLSVSRSGMIGTIVIIIFSGIVLNKYIQSFFLIGVVYLFIFFLAIYLYSKRYDSFLWLFSSTVQTLSGEDGISRVELWKKSVESFMSHPLGWGIGLSGVGAVKYFSNCSECAAIYTTDGWYLKEVNELGGIVAFIFFIILVKKSRIYFIFRRNEHTTFFVLLLWIFLFLNAVVNNVFDFYPYNVLFYYLMGYVNNNDKLNEFGIGNTCNV